MEDDTLVDVRVRASDEPDLLRPLWDDSEPFGSPRSHLLRLEAARLSVARSHEELLSIAAIEDRITLLRHQLDAAHRALFGMDGGALFADEVGLGKTIEVGIVLKEMHFRGTHHTVLLLAPAQLATQWRDELRSKFGLEFVCTVDEEFEGFDAHDRIIASIDTAKADRHFESVTARRWDVVVLDEAHYVRNDDTKRWELLDALEYDYAFFATATPVQNDVTDLYNIVNLIRPGLLGTEEEFERRYLDGGADDGESVANATRLRRALREVMIRHRRDDTDIDFTHRRITTNVLSPSDPERALYDAVTEYVRSNYANEGAKHLVLLTLQKEVVSSPWAVLGTVENWLEDERTLASRQREALQEIVRLARSIEATTKGRYLEEIVERADETVEKGRVIVFTQFRATQRGITERVRELDTPVHVVNGSHSSTQKDTVVREFEAEGGVLVTTDSISEGRNMQFCNLLVNYDLPWNPMSVEQRIGRIDRIGQDREVYVFNLALEGTVEELVLEKLYGKIDLFHRTVGDLRDVLSTTERSGADFENEIFRQLVNADDRQDVENNFEEMAVDLERNREAARKVQDFNASVFESFEFGERTP